MPTIAQIHVLQPRAVLFGEHVMLPGPNDPSEAFFEELAKKRGWQRSLEELERAGILRITGERDPKAQKLGGVSLAGLADVDALKLIEASQDPKELERWHKSAKSKLQKEAILMQLELLKEGA